MVKTTGTPKTNEVNEEKVSLTKEAVEETREQFSMADTKKQYEIEVVQSGVIDTLTSDIDITDVSTIIQFGKEPAEKMAQLADQVLLNYNSAAITGTSKLVDSLLSIMKQINIDEIKSLKDLANERAKKTIFDKFKETAQEKLDKLVKKYKGLGSDIEQICNQLATYEAQINQSNKDIATMYEAAKEEYKELVAVIKAADQACIEIEQYKNQKCAEAAESNDPELQFEIQNIENALTLMQQRTADLRGAEAVALQSIPTFKIQEFTNANLSRKVNSAFIVTVPAFKTALINAVISKQQAIQAQGLMALDEATSQLIRKNADNAVNQLNLSQRLANSSSVKADDIEYSWNTIMNGIQQYKEMEKQYANIRAEESRRIDACNQKYIEQLKTYSKQD